MSVIKRIQPPAWKTLTPREADRIRVIMSTERHLVLLDGLRDYRLWYDPAEGMLYGEYMHDAKPSTWRAALLPCIEDEEESDEDE